MPPRCMLLDKLPPELRNRIYTCALQQSAPITVSQDCKIVSNEEQCQQLLALTCVNKQIRHESLKLFYACNDFVLQTQIIDTIAKSSRESGVDWSQLNWIWAWLADIGSPQASALTNVTLDLGEGFSKTGDKRITHLFNRFLPHYLDRLAAFFHNNKTVCSASMNFPHGQYELGFTLPPLTICLTNSRLAFEQLEKLLKVARERLEKFRKNEMSAGKMQRQMLARNNCMTSFLGLFAYILLPTTLRRDMKSKFLKVLEVMEGRKREREAAILNV